ncbi:glycosyltransferase [Desulfocastanea catecholica]
MLEVIAPLGEYFLLDLASSNSNDNNIPNRIRMSFPQKRKTIWRHLLFWSKAVSIALKTKPKIIIGEDYFTVFPAWLASVFCGAQFIYDAHELIIPDESRAFKCRALFWYRLEKFVINKADLIIAANIERAVLMKEHYKLAHTPIVMRNIPTPCNIDCEPNELLRVFPALANKASDEKWALYQGFIAEDRGIGRFVEALRYLPENYRMIIAGDGPFRVKLSSLASDLIESDRLLLLGRIENRILNSLTILADVGIVCYPNTGLNNIYCAPNKLFEYAQACLPVIATNQPPLRKLIETYSIGETVLNDGSPNDIANSIIRIAKKKEKFCSGLKRLISENPIYVEIDSVRDVIKGMLK